MFIKEVNMLDNEKLKKIMDDNRISGVLLSNMTNLSTTLISRMRTDNRTMTEHSKAIINKALTEFGVNDRI